MRAGLDCAGGALLVAAIASCFTTPLTGGSALAQIQSGVPTKSAESHRLLRLTRFYDSPVPLPAGKPGELIRSEPFDEYDLPFDVSAVRILYHSRSANGEDVVASGVVLLPGRTPPAAGWPVIAWAHAFSGTARWCAPSLMKNLHSGPFLSMYLHLGYAIVATDYVGLGTNFRNAFLDMQSNAMDVIYSVSAARAAVPRLGPKWVAGGDSEGGLAALEVAELESAIRDPNYLGGIAISVAADVQGVYSRFAQGPWPDMLAFLAYGIRTVYPEFQVSDILTEKGLLLYQRIEHACPAPRMETKVSADKIVKPDWENNKFVKQFFSRNTLGEKPANGPILMISGDEDSVAMAMTAQALAHMCKQGDRIQLDRYPDLDSGSVIGGSVADQIAWIQARFAGRATPSNCP